MTEMIEPGCQFASDNTSGMCPAAIEAMEKASYDFARPYGEDRWTAEASDLLREVFEVDCDVFFTFNGTAANSLALASLCKPYHSVITHELAHIETDECGGPEFFSGGTKILLVSGDHGCVNVDHIAAVVRRRTDVHYPKPKVLSITQSTEMGTVYDERALDQVHETVRRFKLSLHMDGARFANAVASLGLAPKELTWKRGVDVLCFGGTKNGMAVGDCVVFFNRELSDEFAYRCKQAGQLASKMRFLAAPWAEFLRQETWLDNARHANAMAQQLADSLAQIPGVRIVAPVEANAVFVEFPPQVAERLREAGWIFYDFIGIGKSRLMCSWATRGEHITRLIDDVSRLANQLAEA